LGLVACLLEVGPGAWRARWLAAVRILAGAPATIGRARGSAAGWVRIAAGGAGACRIACLLAFGFAAGIERRVCGVRV